MFGTKVISLFLIIVTGVLGCTAQIVWPKPQLNGRFVGDNTNIEEAPYHVSLESFFFHTCSGAIIGEDAILTAGQCVWRKNQRTLKVRVGTDTFGRGGEVFQIKEIILHENYDPKTKDFDFAIIRLEDKIVFDDKKGPAEVSSDEPTVGSAARLTGFSSIGLNRNLRRLNTNIIDESECANAYRRNGVITVNMFCAKVDNSANRFACAGDVGAPLGSQESGGFVVQGLASWGSGCNRPANPVVFSKISAVSDWIQANTAPVEN